MEGILVKFRRRGEKIAQLHSTKPRLQPKLLHEANKLLLPYTRRATLKPDRRLSQIMQRSVCSRSSASVSASARASASSKSRTTLSFALLRQRTLQVIPTTSEVLLKRRKLDSSPLVPPTVLSRVTFLSPCTRALNNAAGSVVL